MKKIVLLFAAVITLSAVQGQNGGVKMPALDKSPMDMAYFPDRYPVLKIQDKATEPLLARVIYSRPQKGGRTVYGELVEYNKVWRLGANEATEIEFFRDVQIGGKRIAKGKYTMYAIPDSTKWTVILNKDTDIWGAFKYDEKKDVVRVALPTQTAAQPMEAYTMVFEKTTAGVNLLMGWDTVMVSLPIALK